MRYADRVRETTTTTGTGTVDLGGAATGFQSFVGAGLAGQEVYYCIEDGTDWEVGIGTVTDAAPDTLSRDTVLASSNAGAKVSWGAGTKNVYLTLPARALAAPPRGHIDGLILSNNGTDPTHDIDVAAGEATDGAGKVLIQQSASIVKRIDASWAVGTNQGGLDGTESVAGTPDASTWYHVWLILRSDTGVVDVLFSESATAPTLPTGYDAQRRIGAVLTDASENLVPFLQDGDAFTWRNGLVSDLNTTSPATTWTAVALSVPLGVQVTPIIIAQASVSTGSFRGLQFAHGDQADPTNPVAEFGHNVIANFILAETRSVRTNTSQQIRYKASTGTNWAAFVIKTVGWSDCRGRNA